jgi:hypothetical protein
MDDKDLIFGKRMLAVADTQLAMHLPFLSHNTNTPSMSARACVRLLKHSLLIIAHSAAEEPLP